jgi:16S rRNA (cytosine1402-N4)-methyltransferase
VHHDPVLINEIESIFAQRKQNLCVVDATLGLGWHSRMFISHMPDWSRFIGIDRDRDNLAIAKNNLESDTKVNVDLVHSSFADLDDILWERKISEIDFILYDLGVSSAHYDDGDRGFSIRYDAPLDMRFDRTTGKTAKDLVMHLSEKELCDLMWRYADEKKAIHIARAIVSERKLQSIDTTFQLLEIVKKASYDDHSPKRVFQALRIAVNAEFEHVETSIKKAIDRLSLWWQIAIITFHSIEDRIVKNLITPYLSWTIDDFTGQTVIPAKLSKYNKKPILPTEKEIADNPRSRSAKLRVLTRIN